MVFWNGYEVGDIRTAISTKQHFILDMTSQSRDIRTAISAKQHFILDMTSQSGINKLSWKIKFRLLLKII